MSYSKNLRGFEHFATQSVFEKWQQKHPDYVIDSIQPLKNKVIFHRTGGGPCRAGYNGTNPVYGIFITYTYRIKIDEI